MPHTRSAAKRARQSVKNNLKNRNATTAVKTYMKRVLSAAASGDAGRAREELRLAFQKIDKAAKVHAIHWNAAARKKAQASRAVAGLLGKAGVRKGK